MKIKKVEAILKASKTIIVIETPSCQWLSNGKAFYPVHGLPKLTEENIFAMFDIPTEKKDKFFFQKQESYAHLSFTDFDDSDQQLDMDVYAVNDGSTQLLSFLSTTGVLFLPEHYLKPYFGEEIYTLYERTSGGFTYIVAKRGMEIIGLFLPYQIYDENFIDKLYKISALLKNEFQGDEK